MVFTGLTKFELVSRLERDGVCGDIADSGGRALSRLSEYVLFSLFKCGYHPYHLALSRLSLIF